MEKPGMIEIPAFHSSLGPVRPRDRIAALRNDGIFSLEERRAMIRGWLRCARQIGLAGAGLWMFAYDARPDAWDRHTFYFRDGTEPSDPLNRYADLVAEAAAP